MKSMIRTIAIVVLSTALVANSGCTSLQTVKPTQESIVAHKLKIGDKVRIYYRDYRTENLRVVEMTDSGMMGTRRDGTVIAADWSDIYTLEIKRVHAGKTVAVVGAGALATLAVILIYISGLLVGAGG